jgi:hypothetical protein
MPTKVSLYHCRECLLSSKLLGASLYISEVVVVWLTSGLVCDGKGLIQPLLLFSRSWRAVCVPLLRACFSRINSEAGLPNHMFDLKMSIFQGPKSINSMCSHSSGKQAMVKSSSKFPLSHISPCIAKDTAQS